MSNNQNTIENLVSKAVQQEPLGTIKIGGRAYTIDRPRVRTVIKVSELISTLPGVNTQAKDIMTQIIEGLKAAKDSEVVGEIAAVLILGAKHLTEERVIEKKRLFGLIRTTTTTVVDRKKELADELLLELGSDELQELITECLSYQKVHHFFGLIASLYEVNLLKPTGEAEMTASGQ